VIFIPLKEAEALSEAIFVEVGRASGFVGGYRMHTTGSSESNGAECPKAKILGKLLMQVADV
jgi:PhoPQ-activated pathogenicity-related protein